MEPRRSVASLIADFSPSRQNTCSSPLLFSFLHMSSMRLMVFEMTRSVENELPSAETRHSTQKYL